jgi:hypothetical protein
MPLPTRSLLRELHRQVDELAVRGDPAELAAALAALNDLRIEFTHEPRPIGRPPLGPDLSPHTLEVDPCGRPVWNRGTDAAPGD